MSFVQAMLRTSNQSSYLLRIGKMRRTFSSSSPVKLITFTFEIVCSSFKIFDMFELETYLFYSLTPVPRTRPRFLDVREMRWFMNIPECRKINLCDPSSGNICNQIVQIVICLLCRRIWASLSSSWPPKTNYYLIQDASIKVFWKSESQN